MLIQLSKQGLTLIPCKKYTACNKYVNTGFITKYLETPTECMKYVQMIVSSTAINNQNYITYIMYTIHI